MRQAVLLFVCFATSIAVDSTHRNNSVANEVEKLSVIPNLIVSLPVEKLIPPEGAISRGAVRLSDKSLSNNSLLNRRLRQRRDEDWCEKADDHQLHEILDNCDTFDFNPGYVLRLKSAEDEEAWKRFIGSAERLKSDVEIADSSFTELDFHVNKLSGTMLIENNRNLESVTIQGNTELQVETFNLEIKGNPKLKSVKIEAKEYGKGDLKISDNRELEIIELDLDIVNHGGSAVKYSWTISNNPLLHSINIKSAYFWPHISFYITGNEALSQLDFSESVKVFGPSDVHIMNNDNLESIKIPESTTKFGVYTLEIRRNDKLTSIDLGEQTRWVNTTVVIRENKLLPAKNLETLKKYGKPGSEIQKHGEGPLPISSGGGYSGDTSSTGGRAIPIILLSSLVILGY